ncbi:MAG: hypothetical protein IT269_11750, partial [Saprospiraceae bacterium]|nr:hypothetical protein [Saprospiraceae bacterium]
IATYEFDKSTTNTINGENYGFAFFNTPYKNPFLHSIEKDAFGNTIEEINYTYEKDSKGRITKAIWTYVVPAGKKETHSYTYR